ncbi:FHA domain-containing protein FhaB/FipA [Subtercola sp. YIM 133946]|uniref:FHA domain-containing protein FhaB/FipA n=1 Tax=Subtercola sp. YIM 133946 TaxID=3118909 RepID=UPI003FCD07B9
MSELTLLILRFGFLALLWVFVFVIVYAMRSDLFGQRVRKMRDSQAVAPSATAAGQPGASAGAAGASASAAGRAPVGAAAGAGAVAAAGAGGSGATGSAAGAAGSAAAAPAGFTGLIVGAAATAQPLAESHPPTPPPQSKVPVFTPLEGSSAGVHPRATTSNAHRLIITSGVKTGTEIALGVDPLTIGRSTDSSVVIRDDYTSTHHARLLNWNNEWVIQDLDSTNGTFLDGKRVTQPTPVPLNTPIKIGATSFELRR